MSGRWGSVGVARGAPTRGSRFPGSSGSPASGTRRGPGPRAPLKRTKDFAETEPPAPRGEVRCATRVLRRPRATVGPDKSPQTPRGVPSLSPTQTKPRSLLSFGGDSPTPSVSGRGPTVTPRRRQGPARGRGAGRGARRRDLRSGWTRNRGIEWRESRGLTSPLGRPGSSRGRGLGSGPGPF